MASKHIGDYLIERLISLDARHVFGIPGDYVLGFYDLLEKSPLKLVNTCDEQAAGFAADAYARVRGLGVVCVTYCVGGLKVANATAQAYAEKSPVVVISGAPGMRERENDPLLHHKVRDFDTQRRVFKQLCAATAVLDDPQTAFQEIDRVLQMTLRAKRPVYLELPRDMLAIPGIPHHKPVALEETSDPITLRESLAEATAMLNAAKKPVILADIEVHRYGLQKELMRLIEKTNIPVAATIMGKSVVGENYPFYLGVYGGAMCREEVRRYVEESDCVLMLGAFMSDINLGVFTARLNPAHCLTVTSEKLSIRYHNFEGVRFKDFLRGLLKAPLRRRTALGIPRPPPVEAFRSSGHRRITVRRLFQRLDSFLRGNTIVIADVGDALFGAADLHIHHDTQFLGTAYYASMGFAVPAALGAQLARPERRPLVLVGDGAFQMTGMELTTIARHGLNPVVIVLNNGGYGTERHIHDGPYNDLAPWNYYRLPEVIGSGRGYLVETEGQLEEALQSAERERQFSLLDVHLQPLDRSPALHRLARNLAKSVFGK